MTNLALIAAYRATRQRLIAKGYDATSTRALAIVKADFERAGRYLVESNPAGLASYQNAPGDRGGRWIERPDLAGLRFVGWADKLTGSRHLGWYVDSSEDSVLRAAVYQLPSRGGRPVYVEAYLTGGDSRNGWTEESTGEHNESKMPALVFLNCLHYGEAGGSEYKDEPAIRDAANGADREAELAAIQSREYGQLADLGRDAAQAVETAKAAREKARELLSEMRGLRALAPVTGGAPALCAALRGLVASHLETARDSYSKARKLWDEHGTAPSWAPHLAGAFQDGAEASSYAESIKC